MQNRLRNKLQDRLEGSLDVPNEVLAELFRTRTMTTDDDQPHTLHAEISQVHANALYGTVIAHQPKLVIEVGMAYGVSSLAITTALRELDNGGRLISIDPYQRTGFGSLGLSNLRRADLMRYHEFIEEPDYIALPRLVEQKVVANLAYIDGMHTFDYTLVDFFYADKLLPASGIVAFNDCALPSVRRVLGFVTSHRKYREINVGLRPNYLTANPLTIIQRFVTRTSKADRYYQKLETWEPEWDFYKPF